jgi:hypothetical protein
VGAVHVQLVSFGVHFLYKSLDVVLFVVLFG